MKNFNTNHDGGSPACCKYRRIPVFLTLFLLFFAGGMKAQGPCDQISFSMDPLGPCEFAARYQTQTDCYIELRFILTSGEFSSYDVNTAGGFMVQKISPSELWVTHEFGFIPTGNQVPFLFRLPYDLNTSMSVAFLNDCAQIGCEIIGGWPMESCPDPKDASIIGVKYRECSSLPYGNQPVLSGWTIQLLDVDDNVLSEQLTDAGGGYGFYDLPAGIYVVKETQQPGWMPKVPANGRYSVDLTPSQQAVRNFGNCQLTKPVSGVVYQTCDSMPYLNQPVLSGWVVQFLDQQGNIVAEDTSDSNGAYNEDLPPGQYWVKLAVQPGWTPNFPPSGQVLIDLTQQSQAVQDFGVCYNCCSTVSSWITQTQNTSGKCCYSFTYNSAAPSCVTNFYFIANGIDPSSIVTLPGWTVGWINNSGFQILPPTNGDGLIPSGNFTPVTFCINNNGLHDILTATCFNPPPNEVCCPNAYLFNCNGNGGSACVCANGGTPGTQNLIQNGDFNINAAFSSNYASNPASYLLDGQYVITALPMAANAGFQPCKDHTTSTGNMMVVNGSTLTNQKVWCQTVAVAPNTDYMFSGWAQSLVSAAPALLQITIDGAVVGNPFQLPTVTCDWQQFCASWKSGNNPTADICVYNLNTAASGNDFALDDFSFRECKSTVPCSVSISANPTPFCGTGTLTANPTGPGPFSYQWSHGQNTQSISVQALPCGTVCSVSVTCADGSMSSASYTVSDNVPPVAVCNLGIGIDLGAACTFQVTPAFVDGGSTDNCGIQSMSVSPATLAACTNTIVTLTVTDWCGNTSTCTMGIQTTEGVPPIMTCPANTTINGTVGPTGPCTATFSPVPPVAIDNCDPSVTVTNNAPPVLQQGPNTITWTATDDCGNQTTCTQIVTVQCDCDCDGNLVTNGSFENGTAGFPNALDQINQCSGWYAATNNPAANNTGDWYTFPAFPGFYLGPGQTPLPAHCNEKYAGFFLNTCEGITTQLSQTITQGCSYEVGFWWTPAVTPTTSFSFYAVMSGGNCTMYHPSGSCSHQCNGDQHVIVNVTPNHFAGTWYHHTMTVTNAYPNVGYMTFTAAQGAPNVNNYIFVDDVCVKKLAEPCSVTASMICYPENPIAYTAQASLGCGSVVTQVDWYFDGNGPNSSCCLNSILHPFTTVGFHTVCLVVTASNDGGHTICKDTMCKEVFIDHVPPTKCEKVLVNWQKLHTVDFLCCYALQLDNLEPDCFTEIELTLNSGTFANASITLGWTVIGNLNSNQITLVPTGGGFLPSGYFSPLALCDPSGGGPNTLTVNLLYGPPPVQKCEKSFMYDCPYTPIDSCCLDYDLFCQNVMNAVSVTVDNANCKATLNIGTLPACDYIQKIIWGDGTQTTGNFGPGSMPMHTYAQSGTYVIQYLAIEVNPHTGLICFEKLLTETIVLACGGCCADPSTFNNLIAQGFTVTQNGCSVTVTAPQFDNCYQFTTPPILDGENVQQVITPATGSWTFNIPENGYHQICVTVFDQCNSQEMCTSVKIDCQPPEVDTSCCAYSMYFVNEYTDILHIKKVRVSGICGTEICCADPDEWQQVDGSPNYIEWFEDNLTGVPNGSAIDNDFIIYLKKSGSLQNLEVEWFDATGAIVCRHLLELDCDAPYNEDDDWTLNTSTTALNDPNLFVFAARAPEEDDESDCEEAEEDRLDVSCDVGYTVTCSGGTDYVVNLTGPSGFAKYFWTVIYAPIGVTTYPTLSSVQNPTFTATVGGNYVVSLVAVTASLDTCTNEGDIDIPIIEPDFDAIQLPCGYIAQFVAFGMDNAADVVSWSCPGYPSFPSSGNIVTFDFQGVASVSVTMTIEDTYGCTHEITKQVDIVDCEAGVVVDKYCPDPCSNGTTDVTVHFKNLSKGGQCPVSYTWDYGDGSVNPPNQSPTAGETHTYFNLPCPLPPGGVNYTVTLTIQDAGTCSSTATTTLNISSCQASFTYKACPDGRVDFYGDEPGTWDFTGSIDIAKRPYSDKKDKEGRQKHVRVRYDHSAVYLVKYTPHCPNGSECEILKEVVVDFDCCTKNHRTKDKALFQDVASGKNYKLKGKFRSTQSAQRHKIVAKTRLRKSILKLGKYNCWVRSKEFAITAEFDGNIYGRENAQGCNCALVVDVNHPIVGAWFTPKVKADAVWHKRKLHPRKDSITSTHTAEIDPVTLIQFKLQLGKDCVRFHWWTDWY